MTEHPTFLDCLHVRSFRNAAYFAGELFEKSFASPFPVPPRNSGWMQYVAFYRWPDDRIEVVGFCNFLPFEGAWLEGGLCVRPSFYSRLPQPHSDECRAAGGVAQLIMQAAAHELDQCDAWFAYIGDARSLKVCTRVGYQPTGHDYVMVKWFLDAPSSRRSELIERVAAIGPF